MGAVLVDTYNHSLLEMADYTDLEVLKKLYRNYKGLKKLEEKGDTVASSIRIDLDGVLNRLVKEQKQAIECLLIEDYTYDEFEEEFGIARGTVQRRLNEGLTASRIMLEGVLY